ncbi:flavin reductase family protein [Roseivirga sp.]|uniref:flavin reductase family protein n=1 Tax=Roseivirga sp. TaxID=1964215 RepID=UPI003B52A8C7
MYLSGNDIQSLDKIYRLNLINSVSGIKPANLIGTKSREGHENLAIFSSVIHLGSNPPLIGMVTRPVDEVPRHTYANIRATGIYTINSVSVEHREQAHYTSAKFEQDQSEFEQCGFESVYLENFDAPFVKESPLKLGMELVEELPIKRNGTIMLIGEIKHLFVNDDAVDQAGHIHLDQLNLAGISGLNSYYQLEKKDTFPYARVSEWTPEQKA